MSMIVILYCVACIESNRRAKCYSWVVDPSWTYVCVIHAQADSGRRRRGILRHVGVRGERRPHHLRLPERQVVPGQTQGKAEVRRHDGHRQRLGHQPQWIQARADDGLNRLLNLVSFKRATHVLLAELILKIVQHRLYYAFTPFNPARLCFLLL